LRASERLGRGARGARNGRNAVVRAAAELAPAFHGGASVSAHHIRARTSEPEPLRCDCLSQFWKQHSVPDTDAQASGAGRAEPADGQPLSFSASSVWGVSTRFRLQIPTIPRCEQSFGNGQPLSFSVSSVWGVSTPFHLQIRMIPRCEQSFGTHTTARARGVRRMPSRLSTTPSRPTHFNAMHALDAASFRPTRGTRTHEPEVYSILWSAATRAGPDGTKGTSLRDAPGRLA
jgi:hypothetical protein